MLALEPEFISPQDGADTQDAERRAADRWVARHGARHVNWCALTITREATGEVRYHNAWATNRPVNAGTVAGVVRAGRARWKVENEGYNVLKRRGYDLEHNDGHGQQHLAAVLVALMLLACLSHTVLGRCDRAYQRVRAELGPRRTFFADLRALGRPATLHARRAGDRSPVAPFGGRGRSGRGTRGVRRHGAAPPGRATSRLGTSRGMSD